MTEITNSIMPSINAVEGFNPAEFTRQLPNEDGTNSLYLDVKYRLLWFRLHRPNGKIDTEIVKVDDKSAVVSCKLYENKADPAEQYVARSCAQRFVSEEKFGDRYLEIAETAALGRVLAAAGYGTQFCGSADMLSGIIADAPLDMAQMEDADLAPVAGSSHVVHQINTDPQTGEVLPTHRTVSPVQHTATPVQNTAAPVQTPAPVPQRTTLEDYLNTMTIEEAKEVLVDFGRYSGSKLGDIVMTNPRDLEWYVKNYAGRNYALKAGATILMNAATKMAG